MIDAILPPTVSAFEMTSDPPSLPIFPEEMALTANWIDGKRREFITARHCAHSAMQKLGLPAGAILRGANREPLWPAGLVGSITHCPNYRAAAVAHVQDYLTLGIDAEVCAPLPAGVADLVLVAAERQWLAKAADGFPWDRLMFSAKESLFKAWWPLMRCRLDAADITIDIDTTAIDAAGIGGASGGFVAQLARPLMRGDARPIRRCRGRFLSGNGLIVTAIACTADAP